MIGWTAGDGYARMPGRLKTEFVDWLKAEGVTLATEVWLIAEGEAMVTRYTEVHPDLPVVRGKETDVTSAFAAHPGGPQNKVVCSPGTKVDGTGF